MILYIVSKIYGYVDRCIHIDLLNSEDHLLEIQNIQIKFRKIASKKILSMLMEVLKMHLISYIEYKRTTKLPSNQLKKM